MNPDQLDSQIALSWNACNANDFACKESIDGALLFMLFNHLEINLAENKSV